MTIIPLTLLLLALAGAPKPDTVIVYPNQGMSMLPIMITRPDTTITYHSLSQLPKDTTKRWDVKVAWKWEVERDSVFHYVPNVLVDISPYADTPQRQHLHFDSLKTVWRFVPDSSIVEVK